MSHPFESHFGPYLRLNAWQDTPCVTHNCLWHHAITNTKMYAATYIDVRCFFMLFKQDVIICSSIKHTIFQEILWQIYIFYVSSQTYTSNFEPLTICIDYLYLTVKLELYKITFEPIWLPHCPICRCTISRMTIRLQYTEQLWGSDSNEPSYTTQVMMSSVMTGSECFKKATVIEFTCNWITLFRYWECLPVLFSASKSYILQIHEHQFINHLSSNGLGSLVTMDELLKKKFQWHWEA